MIDISLPQGTLEELLPSSIDNLLSDVSGVTYVSAPCGGGKTYALTRHIKEAFDRAPFDEPQQFMYVAPTLKLLKQFSSDLSKHGIADHTLIASEDDKKDIVFRKLAEHLTDQSLYRATHVTLTTHASFLRLPVGLRNPERWQIFIDEVPQIDQFLKAFLPETRNILAGHVEIKSCTESLAQIDKASGASLKNLLKDTGLAGIKEMLHKLGNPNFTVYSDPKAYDRVFSPTQTDCDSDFSLPLLAIVNADVFDGCCILSANFEDSMLFDLLKRHKKRIGQHRALARGLRYLQYDESIGQRASIKYLLEGGRRYSKSLRDRTTLDGRNIKIAIDETILAHLGDVPYLLVANNDDNALLTTSPRAIRLSSKSHGLNCYQDFTRIVFLSALNRDPMHLSMLGRAGFTQDTIQKATLVEAVHQTVMRTALRDPSSSATVEIIVPDEWSARELGKILGCSNISRLGTITLNDPVVPYTPKEKNQRYNFRKLMKSFPISRHVNGIHQDDETQVDAAISLPSLLKSMKKSNDLAAFGTIPATNTLSSGIQFTLHDSVDASGPREHTQLVGSITDFVKFLKVAARASISRKEEHPLFIPSSFKSSGSAGYRTKDNFVSASCLVLDFDGGILSPEAFEDLFWNQAGPGRKRSFIICNTFSHTAAEPNRFRVIMPFKRPVTSIDVFESIYDSVAKRLEDAGYSREATKLDINCRKPTQSWYLPCTNRAHKEQAFIRTFGIQTREFERYAIEPAAYEFALPHSKPQPHAQVTHSRVATNVSREARQHVNAEKQRLKSMRCSRHRPFFKLGVLMHRKYGFPLYEVESELFEVAGNDPKMKKWVRDAMRSLKRRLTGTGH